MKRILLAEDREDDVILARRALRKIINECEITVARDGEEALEFILQKPYSNFDVAFLDIQMPKLDGLAVLERIRSHQGLRGLPVIMLTTSSNAEDMVKARQLDANSYIVKPLGFNEFVEEMAKAVRKII